jgi:hypothetical protein
MAGYPPGQRPVGAAAPDSRLNSSPASRPVARQGSTSNKVEWTRDPRDRAATGVWIVSIGQWAEAHTLPDFGAPQRRQVLGRLPAGGNLRQQALRDIRYFESSLVESP